MFFGLNASIYETLKSSYNDKYEYILPELILDKTLFNDDRFGNLDLQTNLKIHNYDTNKVSNFIVNDLNWSSKDIYFNSGLKSNILANLKNINYEAKNIDEYKDNPTSEFYGSLGLLSELNLKKDTINSTHMLTPKMLLRFSPGSMRKENSGSRLNAINAFNLNRIDNPNNYETGASATLGFDYNIKKNINEFDFSVAQIINEKKIRKWQTKQV